MKTCYFLILSLLLSHSFSSCSGLNEKEKAVVGAWSQSFVMAKLYFAMKADKSFEAFAQSNLVKGIVITWKGTWKVENDQLSTSISEGPTLVSGLIDAKIGNLLEKFGIDGEKIAFTAKIINAEKDQLNLNLNGLNIIWSRADAEKLESLRNKQADLK
jgi:hypothetical protein